MDVVEMSINRAKGLLDINRYEQAITELKNALSVEPDNIQANNYIAICYLNTDNLELADFHTSKLIRLTPESSMAYYYRGMYYHKLKKYVQAEENIRKAIEINPYNSHYFAILSAIYINRKKWNEALEYADEGLSIDPEDTLCLNYRTMCLTKLNRKSEIDASIEDTLASNPEDDYTHANIGWSKLETGDIKSAQNFFWEALKINPGNSYAKEGMKETIRAKNPVYKLFLQYQFWLSKQRANFQWMFIIGFVIGRRIIFALGEKYPPLMYVAYALVAFTYLTWIIVPFTNIFLFFDKFGRYALDEGEKKSAFITFGCLVAGIVCLILFATTQNYILLYAGIFCLSVVIPLSKYYLLSAALKKGLVQYVTFGLVAIGIIGLLLCNFDENIASVFGLIYLVGFVGYTWLINLRVIKDE